MNPNDVSIILFSIKENKDRVFSLTQDDEYLIRKIKEHASLIEQKGVEVFHYEKNIIATDTGYYGAFYEKNIHRHFDIQ